MRNPEKEIDFQKLIIARMNEATIKDAAKSIGIHERTAHRWLQDPDCLNLMVEFNRQTLSASALIISEGRLEAYANLVQLSRSAKSESVKLRAILALIRLDFPFIFQMETDARLRKVEQALSQLDDNE